MKFKIRDEYKDTVEFHLETWKYDGVVRLIARWGTNTRIVCALDPHGSMKVFGAGEVITEVDVRDFLNDEGTSVRLSDVRFIEDQPKQ